MNQFRRFGRGARSKIIFLNDKSSQSTGTSIKADPGSGCPTTDYNDIVVVIVGDLG